MKIEFVRKLKNDIFNTWTPTEGDKTKNRLQLLGLAIACLALMATIVLGFLQYRINQSLLDLNYMPAMALTHDQVQHRLNISNHGKANLFLCGTRTSYDKGVSFDTPRLIAPGSFYQLHAEDLEKAALQTIGGTGTTTIPMELYFQDAAEGRWKVDNLLNVSARNGTLNIETQTLTIIRVAWVRLGSRNVILSSRTLGVGQLIDFILFLPLGTLLLISLLALYILRGVMGRKTVVAGSSTSGKSTAQPPSV